MHKESLKEWLSLSEKTRLNVFTEISRKIGIPEIAIEKDWWVVLSLDIIFSMKTAQHTVFKGGTSLSKAWGLIQRFSEDIDLSLDREFLGFKRDLSKTQVAKLRKESFKYFTGEFLNNLKENFSKAGFEKLVIRPREVSANDMDPVTIEILYPALTEDSSYLRPKILIEIGSRSLTEPYSVKKFSSFVGEHFKGQAFADKPVSIPTVNPERTFLEKVFLLHEEFIKPVGKEKVIRLSRHLYDIEKLIETGYAEKAIRDNELYNTIVEHRKKITPVRGIDYNSHSMDKVCFIPPDNLLNEWENDYKSMQENMIYGSSLPFNQLISKLKEFNHKINNLNS